jgi:D(-)-tartrate dehydratase
MALICAGWTVGNNNTIEKLPETKGAKMTNILRIREISIPLRANIANAFVNFAEHTVSLVAVESDRIVGGKPVIGYGFNSIGRFAQGGIIRDRLVPRILAADPISLHDQDGVIDPARVAATAMRNEKPGGHGDRAGAVAAIELATWDLRAKLNDEPAWRAIAAVHGALSDDTPLVPVYAAGGYYYPEDGTGRLCDEMKGYADQGYVNFKMKIGGAPLAEDMRRIEAAAKAIGDPSALAVDANGRLDLDTALAYADAMSGLGLRWFEEAGDPLDYELNSRVADRYAGVMATGENLFSRQDAINLARHGGMRRGTDLFQMDPGLSYGVTEFAGMIEGIGALGYDRAQVMPHGGQVIGLHVAAAFGLGGCEAYPGVFEPVGGYPAACGVGGGFVRPDDAPGFGIEQLTGLRPYLEQLQA